MTLRNESGEYITLTLGRSFCEAWAEYELSVKAEVGFITAQLETYAWAPALSDLYEKLSDANRRVSGEVFLEKFTYERDFDLRITYDGLGHAVVIVNLRVYSELDNRCTLSFATDQCYITAFLAELKREADL